MKSINNNFKISSVIKNAQKNQLVTLLNLKSVFLIIIVTFFSISIFAQNNNTIIIKPLPILTGQCSVDVIATTVIDSNPNIITGTTNSTLTYTSQGTYTITWNYNYANGTNSSQKQTIIVNDIIKPVKPILADITFNNGSGILLDPTTTDNCAGIVTGTTSNVFLITAQGLTLVTWVFDYENGNLEIANQNVIIKGGKAATIAQLPITPTENTINQLQFNQTLVNDN